MFVQENTYMERHHCDIECSKYDMMFALFCDSIFDVSCVRFVCST